MDNILTIGGSLIEWLQGLGDWLVPMMEFFSFLGTEEFYLVVAPAILWCWDAGLGLRLGLFLMISASFNSIFKVLIHSPRPYWVDKRVVGLASETSFGAPSGHSQNAVIVWGTLAAHFGKLWAWLIGGSLIFLIGLSRLILAVHYPHDVLIGWLFGGVILGILIKTGPQVVEQLKKRSLSQQLLVTFLFSIGLIGLGLLARLATAYFSMPLEWAQMAAEAFPDEPINPLALSGLISNTGALFGLAAGAFWLEHQGGFRNQGTWWQLFLRYIIGLVGVLILWFGLGEVFPRGEEFLPYLLRYLRYALVGFWMTGLAPFVFRKLNLAKGRHQST